MHDEKKEKNKIFHFRKMKYSDALLAFTAIALIAGLVLMLTYILQDEDDRSADNHYNLNRSTLLLLAAVALGVLVLVFQRREAADFVKSML